ncbi:hypothetical protein GCM10009847_10670 [Leucobacter tardus]|uniref:Uncharacterized protein n=1 Tax=Leucobacter tardus TaxID=501483 RepID=A0A939TMA4_9MICO|nr:hypothetical protein [Leucobacter tardus]MBO2989263.1 hypothetical protein [Leucobacter tardus]
MATATDSTLHYSPRLGRYARCIASKQCLYGDAHTSLLGLAAAGGAEVSLHSHTQKQTVSPLIAGAYSVGTDVRTRTFREDGTQLTPTEARAWRAECERTLEGDVAQQQSDATQQQGDATQQRKISLEPIEFQEQKEAEVLSAPIAQAPGLRGSVADLQLAESTSNPKILQQLAQHRDPAVRLVVAQNSATPMGSLEELAMSRDNGAGLYQSAAMERLTEKYQDLRDAEELKATARMEADGALQANLAQMPSYRVMLAVPKKRWSAKRRRARARIISRAIEEIAGFLGMKAQLRSWTRSKRRAVAFVRGARGVVEFHLSSAVLMCKGTRQVARFLSHSFAHASSGQAVGHGQGWRAKFREINKQLGLA